MMEAMATDTEVATVEMVATEETEAAAAKEGTVTTGVMAVTEVTVAEGEGTFFFCRSLYKTYFRGQQYDYDDW